MAIPHSELHDKNSWTLLGSHSINRRIREILKLDEDFKAEEGTLDIKNIEVCNKMFASYLEKLRELYPKNKFIQLYTAQFHLRQFKAIRYPIRMAFQLQKDSSQRIRLAAQLILMEVQDMLKIRCERVNEEDSCLDLRAFLVEKTMFDQVRQKVIEQAEIQIRICNEMKKENPKLLQIYLDSQKLARQRETTIRASRILLSQISDNHLDPILFYAKYQLILNHSIQENIQYTKLYGQKLQKYQKFFDENKLGPENMFGRDVGFTVFCNSEPNIGKVSYANQTLINRLGQNIDALFSMSLLKNVPPCLKDMYMHYHKMIAEGEEKILNNDIIQAFGYHVEGYLIEVNIYMNLNPFVTSELLCAVLQRPIFSNREFIYALECGSIDSTTRGIAGKLGAFPARTNVSPGTDHKLSDISEELAEVNEAFNMVFFTDNPGVKRVEIMKTQVGIMMIEKAREIYAEYTGSEGKEIFLKTVDNKKEEYFSYTCKMMNVFNGKEVLKLITLEENTNTKKLKENPQSRPQIDGLRELEEEDSHKITENACEEKENGWIDFGAMLSSRSLIEGKTTRNLAIDTMRYRETQCELLGTLNSPTQRTHNVADSPRIFVMETHDDGGAEEKLKKNNQFSDSTGGKNLVQEKRFDIIKAAASVDTSRWSKSSHQQRVYFLYKVSLGTKYYPKIYRMLFWLFWLGFIVLLGCQIALKTTLDDNVNDLNVKKEVLKCAQQRNYYLMNIESATRILWDLDVEILSHSSFGSFEGLSYTYVATINLFVGELAATNNAFLGYTSSLSENIRENLFQKDVRVYETYFDEVDQSYTYLDNFQATNRIIEVGFEVVSDGGIKVVESENLVNFILRNSLNGLLLKNEEISQILLESLDSQRTKIQINILCYLIGFILLFSLSLAGYLVYFWKQYNKQVINLSAFCRVNPGKLNEAHQHFLKFKRLIERGQNDVYEAAVPGENSPKRFIKNRAQTSEPASGSNKREYKDPDHKGLRNRWLIFVGKFVFLTTLVLLLVGITSRTNQDQINATQDLQSQIYFLDHARARVSLAAVLFLELNGTNNGFEVEGMNVLDKMKELVDDLSNIRRELYGTFIETQDYVKEMDSFQKILMGDACEMIDDPNYKVLCEILEMKGYKPGLIYLLTSLSSLITGQINEYENSDKSEAALKQFKNDQIELDALFYLISTYEIAQLSTIIDESFEQEINETKTIRIYVLVVYFVVVLVVSMLMWRFVLVELKEVVNKFKNVLAVLPADLVFSSFILRSFLVKTSNGALDSVKNEIS